jgi:hypothetical protein
VGLVNAVFPEHTNFGSKLRFGYNEELCEAQREEGFVLCFLRKKGVVVMRVRMVRRGVVVLKGKGNAGSWEG